MEEEAATARLEVRDDFGVQWNKKSR